MQVGVRSMHGLVKTKIVYTLPDVAFVQSQMFQTYQRKIKFWMQNLAGFKHDG